MEYRRHTVIGIPGGNQVQVFEYDNSTAIWFGISPEMFTPKDGKTAKGIADLFIASLIAKGCEVISDKCA